MAPDVSMCHTQEFCDWDIAYERLGPPGTIHIVGYLQEPRRQRIGIFASNTYGISGDHPQEQLQKHPDVITPEYPHRPCVIIQGDLRSVPFDHFETPSWIGSGMLQGSTEWRYNAFSFPICPTHDLPSSNAVHILPWSAFSPSYFPSSIGDGPHCLPDKVAWQNMVQLCLVIQDVWDDIPLARITDLIPLTPRRCKILHETHDLSQPLFTLLHLTEKNSATNFCLANNDSRQIADLISIAQFLWAVFTLIIFSVAIDVRFFFLFSIYHNHCFTFPA